MIAEDFLTGDEIGEPAQVWYTYTRAGNKVHITEDFEQTLCGLYVWQLVLVEGHPRRGVLCEWCAAA